MRKIFLKPFTTFILCAAVVQISIAQKLHVSPDTHLITYDTAVVLSDKTAEDIFEKAKAWFLIRHYHAETTIRTESKPVSITGTLISFYPDGLGVFTRYQNEIVLRIEDGAVNVVIDSMAKLNDSGRKGASLEYYFLNSKEQLKTGALKVAYYGKTVSGLNAIVANLTDYIMGKEEIKEPYAPQYSIPSSPSPPVSTTASTDPIRGRGGLSFFIPFNHPDGNALYFPGITIAPEIRIHQTKNLALSASFPVTVGWGGNSFAGIDIPAMIDLNIGSAAGNNDNAMFGMIVGGGLAFLYAENSSPFTDIAIWGYRTHAGFSFGRPHQPTRNVVLFTYGKSATLKEGYVYGISFQLIFMKD